jgi:hypothetical protein
MIPIKWNETSWVETTTSDSEWYDYDNKNWANAKTADGSMWVWIPRYAYQIASGYHTNTEGTINIKFLQGMTNTANDSTVIELTPTYSGGSQTNYIKHPAFTFGSTELAGIWVAKFEPTAAEGLANNATGDNVTTKTVKILPNVQSWRYINVGNAYQTSRNMETNSIYGWGTTGTGIDTHLIKNIEWGAVAYLSKSIYGKETEEIWVNPANNYTTGCAGDSVSSATTTGCLRTYETPNGIKASSTGTIYGIYDLSGCSWERVSAYLDNTYAPLSTHGSQIVSADAKYKDIYPIGSSDTSQLNYEASLQKGDAVYETSSTGESNTAWFADYSGMPNTNYLWFVRGANYDYAARAGVYSFINTNGSPYINNGFRPVLVVGEGL